MHLCTSVYNIKQEWLNRLTSNCELWGQLTHRRLNYNLNEIGSGTAQRRNDEVSNLRATWVKSLAISPHGEDNK